MLNNLLRYRHGNVRQAKIIQRIKKISETRLERKKIYQVNIPENRYVDRLEKKKKKRKQGEN